MKEIKVTPVEMDYMHLIAKQAASVAACASPRNVVSTQILKEFVFSDGRFRNSFRVRVSKPVQDKVYEYLVDVSLDPRTAESSCKVEQR